MVPLNLFELTLDHVPEVFIRRLMHIVPIVYQEAWERSYSDPAWDEPEARFIHPLHRRVLVESQFRRIGREVGLDTRVELHNGQNCEYSVVRAGPFFVTVSAVETEKVFPRQAVSREQNSLVNFMLDQMTFPSMIPHASDEDAQTVYAIITHGTDGGNLRSPGFLNFGIPRASGRSWAEQFSFTRLINGYDTRRNACATMETIPRRCGSEREEEKGQKGRRMIGTVGFVGERLKEAREARGLTRVMLGELVGVSPMSISHYEKGTHRPRPGLTEKIARQLNLPERFFLRPVQPVERKPQNIFWRSYVATKQARIKCERRFRWLENITAYLAHFLDFPAIKVPNLQIPEDSFSLDEDRIEAAAEEARCFWGLGDGPISEVFLLAENNGIIVSHMSLGNDRLDAFSQWLPEGFAFIVIGSERDSAVRCRYSAAHEIAHLVLHKNQQNKAKSDLHSRLEWQAFRFASAFLLPPKSFLSELWAPTLDAFRSLKERWKVSIGVMIKRCEELGVINDKQAQRLWINYARRGWKKQEPLDDSIAREAPRMLRRGLELLIWEGIRTKQQILDDLWYNPRDLEDLICLPVGFFQGPAPSEVIVLPKREYQASPASQHTAKIISFSKSKGGQ